MSNQVARATVQAATLGRPIVSQTHDEAKKRVLASYKKWCVLLIDLLIVFRQRQLPRIRDEQHFYDYPMGQFRLMIKEQFTRNQNVTDLRVIDRLVAKVCSLIRLIN